MRPLKSHFDTQQKSSWSFEVFLIYIYICYIIYIFVLCVSISSACVYNHLSAWCMWRAEGGIGSLGLGLQMVVNHMGAENQIQVLCKSSQGLQALSHLSSSCDVILKPQSYDLPY